MKRNKYLIFIIVGLCTITNVPVFAANRNDCALTKATISQRTYTNLYPQEALEQAMTNMHAYCCQEKLLPTKGPNSKTCQNNKAPDIYPQSAFLYDHLIDIGLRRLDGIDALTYNVATDDTGKERRENISEIAEKTNGETPSNIQTTFAQQRTLPNTAITLEHRDHAYDSNQLTKLNNQYSNAPLIQKYKAQCGIALAVYDNITINTNRLTTNVTQGFHDCKNLVTQRITQEYRYVETVLMHSATTLLHNNMKSYLQDYFAKDRLLHLQETVFQLTDVMKVISKQVQGTRQCTN